MRASPAADERGRADNLAGIARERAEAVLGLRSEVLTGCRVAAGRPPGRHSLTVPTGGGKTLAALAFALRHAAEHGLRRVIVVIPFTSIIDQTAEVYRRAFGDDLEGLLIEHHSNLDPTRETEGNRLASENWDAPIIVTTAVQFFESLFSDRGTAARKLHNIAGSVVVFDEVQALPHPFRSPIFDALNQLVDHYGVSTLFCTATQPALGLRTVNRQPLPHLPGVVEVMPDVPGIFQAVGDRVVADFSRARSPIGWDELAGEIEGLDQVLAIVQRRDDARDLCRLLPDALHLSALMCPAHRRAVLARIKADLDAGRPCRVVSTTLVEAGVDLSFPVVYRALGGVDALAQAAGRCNRSGRLVDARENPIPGRLIVFRPPTDPPPGLRLGAETTASMLAESGEIDLFDPATYEQYFQRLFSSTDFKPGNLVQTHRLARDFPEIATSFRMIDDRDQISIVVPYGDAWDRIREYQSHPDRKTLRALQPYLVNVPTRDAAFLTPCLQLINDQVRWIASPPQYDDRFGLVVDALVPQLPADLVV